MISARETSRAWIVMMLLIGVALALVSWLSIRRQERTDDGTGIATIIAPDSAQLSQFL